MSELQLGLIIVGVVAVIAVYAFNRLQERQFRRRVENAYQDRPRDVLLDPEAPAPNADARIEPHLGGEPEPAADAATPAAPLRPGEWVEQGPKPRPS